jgi:hypothetical protein
MGAVMILVWLPTTETVELIAVLLAGMTAASLIALGALVIALAIVLLLGWLR